MHYFIDGYNLLFRLMHDRKTLQTMRDDFIRDLNTKISLLRLNVSVVFDAIHCDGDGSRNRWGELEILFSAKGETADELILNRLARSLTPNKETVITSDKTLARLSRAYSAKTKSVEEFVDWLNRSYQNKPEACTRPKKHANVPSQRGKNRIQEKTIVLSAPSEGLPLEPSLERYLKIFESKFEESLKNEAMKISPSEKPARPKRHPRKKSDPFAAPPSAEIKAPTETERWLRIFEDRLKE